MIITHLKVSQDEIPLTARVMEPDRGWSYKRADDMVVKWAKEGDHWHIPYLTKKARLAEPQYVDGEQYNEGEIEEYYIDPINGKEVEPGYVTKEVTRTIAGRTNIECMAWLTADEMKWITPKGELPRTVDYKRTVSVWFMGGEILLRGVWSGRVLEQKDDLVHIELHVDKVDPVK